MRIYLAFFAYSFYFIVQKEIMALLILPKLPFIAPVQHSHISNPLFRGSLERPFFKTGVSLETLDHLSLMSSIMNNLVFSSLPSNFLL